MRAVSRRNLIDGYAEREFKKRFAAGVSQKSAFHFAASRRCFLTDHENARLRIRVELPRAPDGAAGDLRLQIRCLIKLRTLRAFAGCGLNPCTPRFQKAPLRGLNPVEARQEQRRPGSSA